SKAQSHTKSWGSKMANRLSSLRSPKPYMLCGLVSRDNGTSLEVKQGICCDSPELAANCRISEKVRAQMHAIHVFNAAQRIASSTRPESGKGFFEVFSKFKVWTSTKPVQAQPSMDEARKYFCE